MRSVLIGSILSGACVALFFACNSTEAGSEFQDAGTSAAETGPGFDADLIGEGGDAIGSDSSEPPNACGNGVKNPDTEICDDGNKADGDGCTAKCRVEAGWVCPIPGAKCTAITCGDKLIAGDEDCDDGNANDADGCSSKCRVEEGYKCGAPGTPCEKTTCGDNKKEGVEQCDDGNLDPFDGCDPDCRVEPKCAAGTCTAVCGDGLKFPGEFCDDGNVRSGDGCSSTCALEPGFTCTNAVGTPPASKSLYIAYRDFKAAASAGGHPDFLAANFTDPAINVIAKGLVQNALDAQGKPQFLSRRGTGNLDIITDATSFSSWFRDTAFSKKVVSKITLGLVGGSYVFDDSNFFPLDAAPGAWPERQDDGTGTMRNFLFTSELRIPFTYKGGEVLTFRGDDDVWVFVNGKLAVDIGGVKEAKADGVTLDAAKATQLGLVVGGMYEFVVFQAERNPTSSNYKLTLNDFDKVLTKCQSVCGDGVKTPDEVCDDGTANNTGGYGRCNADCSKRGPFCGDGVVQADQGEQCDSTQGCTADCRRVENGPR